jgi:LysR family nitrogen assimilation transcriptional regulator
VELRHLRYFVAVAEAGSVSLAARRLNGTQPALSRQIRDLEQELGVRLFDRIGRKIVLMVDGDELLGHARRLLADTEAFRERAQALGGGESGVLRIGGTPQFIEAALPEVLARYRRARPVVEVRVIEDGQRRSLHAYARENSTWPSACCVPRDSRVGFFIRCGSWPS